MERSHGHFHRHCTPAHVEIHSCIIVIPRGDEFHLIALPLRRQRDLLIQPETFPRVVRLADGNSHGAWLVRPCPKSHGVPMSRLHPQGWVIQLNMPRDVGIRLGNANPHPLGMFRRKHQLSLTAFLDFEPPRYVVKYRRRNFQRHWTPAHIKMHSCIIVIPRGDKLHIIALPLRRQRHLLIQPETFPRVVCLADGNGHGAWLVRPCPESHGVLIGRLHRQGRLIQLNMPRDVGIRLGNANPHPPWIFQRKHQVSFVALLHLQLPLPLPNIFLLEILTRIVRIE